MNLVTAFALGMGTAFAIMGMLYFVARVRATDFTLTHAQRKLCDALQDVINRAFGLIIARKRSEAAEILRQLAKETREETDQLKGDHFVLGLIDLAKDLDCLAAIIETTSTQEVLTK